MIYIFNLVILVFHLMVVLLIVCRLARCGWLVAYNANLSAPRNGWRKKERKDDSFVLIFEGVKMNLVD